MSRCRPTKSLFYPSLDMDLGRYEASWRTPEALLRIQAHLELISPKGETVSPEPETKPMEFAT